MQQNQRVEVAELFTQTMPVAMNAIYQQITVF